MADPAFADGALVTATGPTDIAPSLPTRLRSHTANAPQLLGILTLLVTGAILIFLSSVTFIATIVGVIILAPLVIVSSPIWFPIAAFLFVTAAGLLFVCGLGFVTVFVPSWIYRYLRGMNPPGSDRFISARNRIYNTANQVKDYAREYSGYLQSKVKDAAPGA